MLLLLDLGSTMSCRASEPRSCIGPDQLSQSAQSAVVPSQLRAANGTPRSDITAHVHLKLLQAKLLCNILDENGWNVLERVSQQNACEFIACILIILYNCTQLIFSTTESQRASLRKRHHGRYSTANYFLRCDSWTTGPVLSILNVFARVVDVV